MTTHIIGLIHISLPTNIFLLLLFLLLHAWLHNVERLDGPQYSYPKIPRSSRHFLSSALTTPSNAFSWSMKAIQSDLFHTCFSCSFAHQNILYSFGIQTAWFSPSCGSTIISNPLLYIFLQTLYLVVVIVGLIFTRNIANNVWHFLLVVEINLQGLYYTPESILFSLLSVSIWVLLWVNLIMDCLQQCYSILPDKGTLPL